MDPTRRTRKRADYRVFSVQKDRSLAIFTARRGGSARVRCGPQRACECRFGDGPDRLSARCDVRLERLCRPGKLHCQQRRYGRLTTNRRHKAAKRGENLEFFFGVLRGQSRELEIFVAYADRTAQPVARDLWWARCESARLRFMRPVSSSSSTCRIAKHAAWPIITHVPNAERAGRPRTGSAKRRSVGPPSHTAKTKHESGPFD